jgi:hypothetical protein
LATLGLHQRSFLCLIRLAGALSHINPRWFNFSLSSCRRASLAPVRVSPTSFHPRLRPAPPLRRPTLSPLHHIVQRRRHYTSDAPPPQPRRRTPCTAASASRRLSPSPLLYPMLPSSNSCRILHLEPISSPSARPKERSFHLLARLINRSNASWVTTRGRSRIRWLNLRRRRSMLRRRPTVLPWPPGPPKIRPPVEGIRSRFESLEPRPRSSRVSQSVHLPIGLFVCIRGLEEGTLSIKVSIRVRGRPGPVAPTPQHRIV